MKRLNLLAAVMALLLLLSACAGDPDTSSVSPAPSESESSSTVTDAGDTSAQPDESQPAGDEGAASTPDVEGEPEKEPEPTPEQTPDTQPEKEPEHTHDYSKKITAPTTEAEGFTLYVCDGCGDSYKDDFVDKLPEASETVEPAPEHKHAYKDTVVAPTCEKGGYTVHSCDCGHSYSDKETKATGHSYTEKVVAPTTSAQGYTLHTCSKCGTSYKDNYVDKLPTETKPVDPKPTQPSNPGNVEHEEDGWKPDNYGSGDRVEGNVQEAGQFTDIKDYSRSFYSAGMSAADARSALNNYVGRVYGRRFFSDGISINDADVGKFAKIVARDDGKLGVNVFGWRKSYDSDVIQNTCINMVMEAFYFFTGDKNVAYALWSWVDAQSINGSANSDNYGFRDVEKTANGWVIEMNGVQIEFDTSGTGTTYYFN